MTRILANRRRLLNLMFFLGISFSCAGPPKKQPAPADEEKAIVKAQADTLQVEKGQMRTQLKGNTLNKVMSYPYLTLRFKQKDTEVEMVVDPLTTNLTLDLRRDGEGGWQIYRGDSLLTEKRPRPNVDSLKEEISPLPADSLNDLTDEIVRDINLAQSLFYQRKYEEALRVLNMSLQKRPTAAAYALGGSIYFINGDVPQAVKAWQEALKLNPHLDEVKRLVARYKHE